MWLKNLRGDLGSPDAVLAVQRDFRRAGLAERDIARLREHGFSDEQISAFAPCAAFRNFISRFFDAVGATPHDEYRALDPTFRDPLCVGRPFPG